MRDKRISVSNNCIFVLPASDAVELLISYKGFEWSNENINEDRLYNFSQNCEGFNITFFENTNGKILMFSQKGESAESIDIYFEGIFMESLPCAFFDKDSKTYDNFVLPSSTTEMVVSVGSDATFTIEWEFENEESTADEGEEKDVIDEDDELVVDLTQKAKTKKDSIVAPLNEETNFRAENERLTATCEELTLENDTLHARTQSLQTQISTLELKIKELEEGMAVDSGSNDKDREINELNRLIRQLADDRFNGSYVETMDAEINSLTASVSKQSALLAEKKKSKQKLERDLQEIESSVSETKEEISRLMVCIDKAESIQSESSTELGEKQERIKTLLADLGMDMETLEMYSVDETLENILSETTAMKERLEEKLKSLIQERQRDCDERSNRLKGNS